MKLTIYGMINHIRSNSRGMFLITLSIIFIVPNILFATARVGISGDMFTINGKKEFLLGTSYFDGMHWKVSDLEYLHNNGFNLVRVWLDWWTLSHYNDQGILTSAGKSSLLALVRKADSFNMVVDIAILDNVLSFGGDSSQKREAAVRSVVSALKDEPNVIFDLFNEHKNYTGPHKCGGERINLSDAEVRHLIRAAKSEDPGVLITASAGHDYKNSGLYFLGEGSALKDYNKQNIRDLVDNGVDFLAPHLQRNSKWASETSIRVTKIKNYISLIGKTMPVYLQEDMRRGGGVFCVTESSPTGFQRKEDFFTAAKGALYAGAAGWVFHTGAGFHLDKTSYFNALDSVEKQIVQGLADYLGLADGSRNNAANVSTNVLTMSSASNVTRISVFGYSEKSSSNNTPSNHFSATFLLDSENNR